MKSSLLVRHLAMVFLSLMVVYQISLISLEGSSKQNNPSRAISHECAFGAGSMFLISSMTSGGERGWLLCVDPTSKRSWLYRVPWMIQLYPEQSQSNVSLMLTSKELSDGSKYRFEAGITGDELKGSLIIRDPLTTPTSRTYTVQGFRLNLPTSKVGRFPAGRYSSSRYIEESGDSVGAELLLFLTEGQYAGLIKFNESYWGEPEFVPLVLRNIRIISSQKLEFDLRLGDQETGSYSATRRGGTVILERLNLPTGQDAQCKLIRQRTLLPQNFFH